MNRFFVLFGRGLMLRCPVCGKGKLFRTWFRMYERCPNCGYRFEREEGYFSASMAINLVISELLIAAFVVPLAANTSIPMLPVLLWGAPLPFLLPLLFYHHSLGLWLAMDHFARPLERDELPEKLRMPPDVPSPDSPTVEP